MRYIVKDFSFLTAREGGHLYFRPMTAEVARKYITECPMLGQAVNNSYVAKLANDSLGGEYVDYCAQDVRLNPGDDLVVCLVLEDGTVQWYHARFANRFSA